MDRYAAETFLKRRVPIKGGGEKTAVHSERDCELCVTTRIEQERDRNMTDLEKKVEALTAMVQQLVLDQSTPSEVKQPVEQVSITTTTTPAITFESDLTKIRGVAATRALKLNEFGAATIGDVAHLEQNKVTAKKAGIPWVQFEGIIMEAKAMITATPTENAFGKKSWDPSQEGNLETKVLNMSKEQLARTLDHLISTEQWDEAKRVSAIVASGKTKTKATTTPKKTVKAKEREAAVQKEFEGIEIVDFNSYVLACASLDKVFFPSLKRNNWIHKSEQTRCYKEIFKAYQSGAIDLEFVHTLAETITKEA